MNSYLVKILDDVNGEVVEECEATEITSTICEACSVTESDQAKSGLAWRESDGSANFACWKHVAISLFMRVEKV